MNCRDSAVRFNTLALDSEMPKVLFLLCDWCGDPFVRTRSKTRDRIREGKTTAFCEKSCSSRWSRSQERTFHDEPVRWSDFTNGTVTRPDGAGATDSFVYSKIVCDGCDKYFSMNYRIILQKLRKKNNYIYCSDECFYTHDQRRVDHQCLPLETRPDYISQQEWKKYRNYQRNAAKRSYKWDLTYEQFSDLANNQCNYCNKPSYGIDRVDNSVGYTLGNCVPACKRCNWKKSNESRDEFLSHSLDVVLHSIPLNELQKILQSKIESSRPIVQ